jgi:hypothetical protein
VLGITKEIHWTQERRFPEIDDAVFTFFQETRKTGLFVSYDILCEEG